jgi:hypothetical protein
MHEFIDLAALGIGSSGAPSKHNVSDGINARVRAAGIDEFPMQTTLLPDKELGNILTCVKALGEVARIGGDSSRCGGKLRVSTRREIDWKREFAANGNEAAGNVSTRNRTGVPSVNKKKDGFEGNPDGITFICHDTKLFIQVSIDALNEHGVMVVARQNMIVDVEEIKEFLEYTHKLGVLVQDDRMAKAVSENDAHEGRGECFSGSVRNRFHRGKETHSTARYEVYFGTFETFDGAGLIRVNVEDHHKCLDWEIVNEFVGF